MRHAEVMSAILEKLKSRFPQKSFARNVLTLMSGTVSAQALLILIAPVLTRLYGPEEFGLFALYTSLLSVLGVISCGRYELAIVLPKEEGEAANIFLLSLIVCLLTSLLVLPLFLVFRSNISVILKTPALSPWLLFLPFQLFVQGVFLSLNYWGTRQKQFGRLATRQVTQSSGTALGQIGLGFLLKGHGSGLICGALFGQTLATARLAWQTLIDDGNLIRTSFSTKAQRELLSRYRDFPLFSTWTGFMNTLSTMLPALLLGYYFSPTIVGFYSIGQRLLSLPMTLIGGALAQAFYPHATEAFHSGHLRETTRKTFIFLVEIGLLPFSLLSLLAPDAFKLIFGLQWETAGIYIRWLALWIFFVFISSPLSTIYLVMNKQRLLLSFNLIMLVTRTISLIFGGLSDSPLLTIQLFGVTGFLLYSGNCFLILNLSGLSFSSVLFSLWKPAIESFIFTTPVLLSLALVENSLLRVAIGTVCFAMFAAFKGTVILKKPV
ncbi:MAG: lipopolysaccharide biosynthesis protein [Synergistales bacterium]